MYVYVRSVLIYISSTKKPMYIISYTIIFIILLQVSFAIATASLREHLSLTPAFIASL